MLLFDAVVRVADEGRWSLPLDWEYSENNEVLRCSGTVAAAATADVVVVVLPAAVAVPAAVVVTTVALSTTWSWVYRTAGFKFFSRNERAFVFSNSSKNACTVYINI